MAIWQSWCWRFFTGKKREPDCLELLSSFFKEDRWGHTKSLEGISWIPLHFQFHWSKRNSENPLTAHCIMQNNDPNQASNTSCFFHFTKSTVNYYLASWGYCWPFLAPNCPRYWAHWCVGSSSRNCMTLMVQKIEPKKGDKATTTTTSFALECSLRKKCTSTSALELEL